MADPYAVIGNSALMTATVASAALPFLATPPFTSFTVRITNTSATITAFVAFGISTVAAVIPTVGTPSNGTPVGPNQSVTFAVNPRMTHWAAITPSSTADLYVSVGVGG